MHRAKTLAIGLGAASCFVACDVSVDANRGAWLANTIVNDNQPWLARDPNAVAQKFAKMADTRYAFFRGTAPQFHRDMSLPEYSSRYSTAASSEVLLVGDPHLENLGTYRSSDDVLFVDWNDFDAGGYGSYLVDVRRLALSLLVAAETTDLLGTDDRDALEVVGEMARAYSDEIRRIASAMPTTSIREDSDSGAILADLLRRSRESGDEQRPLAEYTEVLENGSRRFLREEIEPAEPDFVVDTLRDPSPSERQLVEQAMIDYFTRAPQQPVKDIVRKLGAGVASYPLLRFYVLCEGASPDVEDDVVLEFKEVSDPPTATRITGDPRRRFRSNGERIVAVMQAGQETAINDVNLGYATVQPWSFRARTVEGYQDGLSTNRIAERIAIQYWRGPDLADVARDAGRLLARTHGQATTASGSLGAAAIAEAISGDESGFVGEAVGFIAVYRHTFRQDYRLFTSLLRSLGPTLGYR